MKQNPHVGSSLDDLLEEEGILDEINMIAIKRVIVWQIQEEMKKQNLSKTEMAKQMNTSRSSLDRLLKLDNFSVTLDTIGRAASAIGKRLRIELVDAEPHDTFDGIDKEKAS
jgi:antitoxin HicB